LRILAGPPRVSVSIEATIRVQPERLGDLAVAAVELDAPSLRRHLELDALAPPGPELDRLVAPAEAAMQWKG
jgi:hypothetical protein